MRTTWLLIAVALLLALLALSGFRPYDRATWALEVAPIAIALPILWTMDDRFPLTTLLYAFIFVHAVVMRVRGGYTFARVPFGFQIADMLGVHRNPYAKIGHFFQRCVPAIAAREILRRGGYARGPSMLAFAVVCIALAISATYELIEWAVALLLGQGADEFLGTLGDPWDAQSDMFAALVGAVTALLLTSRIRDRQIRERASLSGPAR